MTAQDRVALVVGAGGPTGGPFIWAALEAIEERTGWVASSADQIIGTSAGAFVASAFDAKSEPVAGSVDRLAMLANGESLAPEKLTMLAGALRAVAATPVAMVAPMNKPLAAYDVRQEPYHPGASAVTVQRRRGQRVHHLLAESNDVEAVVRASAAIPGVNQPIEIDGVAHVDGAVHSANNADLVTGRPELLLVISPMIPLTGGSLVSRFHRAQLRVEISQVALRHDIPAVVVMPSQAAHAKRRDREPFAREGAEAVARL